MCFARDGCPDGSKPLHQRRIVCFCVAGIEVVFRSDTGPIAADIETIFNGNRNSAEQLGPIFDRTQSRELSLNICFLDGEVGVLGWTRISLLQSDGGKFSGGYFSV